MPDINPQIRTLTPENRYGFANFTPASGVRTERVIMRFGSGSALITGGASGLGLATVERLVAAGSKVVIADLPRSPGADVATRLGNNVVFCPTDVTDEDAVKHAVTTAAELAPLRLVVNCAGVATPNRVINREGEPSSLAAFTQVITINLIGTFNTLRLAAQAMRTNDLEDGDRGVIINTASVAAFDGQVGQAAYSASKAGVAGMTLPVARDLAQTAIRVMAIAPGLFLTPMLMGLPEEAQLSLGKQTPHPPRLGQPSEYAQLVESIVTNAMLNGETIRLDGAVRLAPR